MAQTASLFPSSGAAAEAYLEEGNPTSGSDSSDDSSSNESAQGYSRLACSTKSLLITMVVLVLAGTAIRLSILTQTTKPGHVFEGSDLENVDLGSMVREDLASTSTCSSCDCCSGGCLVGNNRCALPSTQAGNSSLPEVCSLTAAALGSASTICGFLGPVEVKVNMKAVEDHEGCQTCMGGCLVNGVTCFLPQDGTGEASVHSCIEQATSNGQTATLCRKASPIDILVQLDQQPIMWNPQAA
mmetsp:Transcript_888/g.1996  ORF Transcript_888/g.1996 Transcript_888/m.1996 type:complete len:242 (-) Transcript_888:276-1001(-)|eukprot:CAMPEP_0206448232 /NCGR_PEP_ID=MMETSP0324_2-20121206/17325_1 /ASSEMBLY_ACC=CAM_ASM_000836 /TAXON_ID=2866 /ORGANISM="Crypthecodinium cohnii, Strain Seligo" /LENGTH=241 /DNA_ID=CAMNT_0053917287 /DNA_START=127 /DNA_END=852 /DNA_ORIENTATION=-